MYKDECWLRGAKHFSPTDSSRFGRLFPTLKPFARDTEKVRAALLELGKKGGIMNQESDNLDNPDILAGFTFLGQFIDHDITFDPTSSFEQQNDPESIKNFRTPALELDNIYGGGPIVDPHLYDITTGGAKFLIEKVSSDENAPDDIPRNSQNTGLIVDPRNDENMIIGQLHLAFLKFHNAVVDHLANTFTNPIELFSEAQKLVDQILKEGRKFYKWQKEPFIPVEFAMAAYRFGHSQVRPFYRANAEFAAPIFNASVNPTDPDPNDLRGGKRAPRRFVQWGNFFNTGTSTPLQGKRIDTTISSPLFELPFLPFPNALPQRNLLRELAFGLPSGQDVARKMSIKPLRRSDLADVAELGFARKTPLWFYILREAEVKAEGKMLGPVGGRIVAEVLIGLLQGDEQSFLSQNPYWVPTLGLEGKFSMVDLLKFAGAA